MESDGNGHGNVRNIADRYTGFGFGLIPVRTDGSKAPAVRSWKQYQDPENDRCDLSYFENDAGIGVLCGKISQNMEVLDFDERGLFAKYRATVEKLSAGLLSRCVIISTPSGGHHVWYRCEDPPEGNQKLAWTKDGKKARIETRGEGGYVLAPGCPASCHATGKTYRVTKHGARIGDIPTLTQDERQLLLRVAKSFDRRELAVPVTVEVESKGRPGDEFNTSEEVDWGPILEPHGWVCTGSLGELSYWRRPGKKTGVSATTGMKSQGGNELFCCFTTSVAEFDGPTGGAPCSSHSKFDAYARLNHKGNHKKASAVLAEKYGFGGQEEATKTHWYTYREMLEMDWEVEYLIPGILAANHNMLLFGPSKSLKTSIVSDLAISLATGTPFLNKWEVSRQVRVGLISGESGKASMRDTFVRVAGSKDLLDIPNFIFSPNLPKLASQKKLVQIENDFKEHGLEVFILDPAYLCIQTGDREGSLFAVGAVLNPFFELCDAYKVTPIILHHTKQSTQSGRQVTLRDLSWAGFEQIARQWFGVNRESDYQGGGVHNLLITAGGSPGHNGKWGLTVDEGEEHDQWTVQVGEAPTAAEKILKGKTAERIRSLIVGSQVGLNLGSLVEATGWAVNQVEKDLKTLTKAKMIRLQNGVYINANGVSKTNANPENN